MIAEYSNDIEASVRSMHVCVCVRVFISCRNNQFWVFSYAISYIHLYRY